MKRILIVFMTVVMFFSFMAVSFGATKYDAIKKVAFYQKMIRVTGEQLQNPIIYNYTVLLVNEKDFDRIIQNTSMDSQKRRFISENKHQFLQYIQGMILGSISNNLSTRPKDSEWIYITDVIKTHMSGQSITSTSKNQTVAPGNAAVEKMFFEEHELYKAWVNVRKPGFIQAVCNEQVDLLYNKASKK